MSDLRAAAQQALEALELDAYGEPRRPERDAAITALCAALEHPEPPPEPLSDAKIRAEFLDLDRHCLPGEMTLEDWFTAGVRFAERQHEIV